jgi:hypothetical protein
MHRASLVIAALLLTSFAQAQTTSLRQQRIHAGDIAELIIEYEASIPSLYAIDTAPLEADFKVLDTRSRVTRVLKGKQTMHRMHWSVTLVPRRSGRLRIPALGFGDNHSDVLWLDVEPVSPALQTRQNAFIEIEAIPHKPYPGQQTRIILRLLHNLDVLDGRLEDPGIEQARVFRSGRDALYSRMRDGESFSVLERSILLIPESADTLAIGPAGYRGVITPVNEPGGEVIQEDPRYIYRNSDALQLQVRELPSGFDREGWLPAQDLEMDLAWDEFPQPVTIGDSLGVTLTLQAVGLPAEALPADLLLRESNHFRIYADQANRSTRVEGLARDAQLIGRLQQRHVIIIDQAGVVTLPQLRLTWWDVKRDAARVATLDATSITVAAADPGIDADHHDILSSLAAAKPGGWLIQPLFRYWPWFTAASMLLLIAGLLSAATGLRRRLAATARRALQLRQCRRVLKQACLENDAAAAHRALIAWSRLHWRDMRISSLHSIASRCGSRDWKEPLARLDAALFAARSGGWQGRELWHLVRMLGRTGAGRLATRSKRLPGLYPREI